MKLGQKAHGGRRKESYSTTITHEHRAALDALKERTGVPTSERIRRGLELMLAEAASEPGLPRRLTQENP